MSERFPGLSRTYIGPNSSHRGFRESLANAKALAFVLTRKDPSVLTALLDEAAEIREKSRDGTFAMGVAGRASETSVQLAVHLTGDEIDLIQSVGGFEAQLYGLIYREIYRAFETYLIGLFEEIARADPRVLYSGKHITHEAALRAAEGPGLVHAIVEQRLAGLTRGGLDALVDLFDSLNLTLFSPSDEVPQEEMDDVRRRLELGAALRNILEHNSGVVNREFLERVPHGRFELGQTVEIDLAMLGDLFSAVEAAADGLNRRAVAKYSLA